MRKVKNIFLNIAMLISIGLCIYGVFPITKIYTDGTPILAQVFDKSLQERYVQFPAEMKSASARMYIFVALAFVLFFIANYLNSKSTNTEPEPAAQAEIQPESMPKDNTPSKEADWYQWRDAYYQVIVPFLQANKNRGEITAELRKGDYPSSKYTDIRRAGELGQLIEFKKKK